MNYFDNLDYGNIKFNTQFGRMTMEELAKNVEIKAKVRDVFDAIFEGIKGRVIKTVDDFQKRLESLIEGNSDPNKEIFLLVRSYNAYFKTFKNFPIPNFNLDATGAKELMIMDVGGAEKGMIKKAIVNGEELEVIEINSPTI